MLMSTQMKRACNMVVIIVISIIVWSHTMLCSSTAKRNKITHLCSPVSDGEKVFREERIALQGVNGTDVSRVDDDHLLLRRFRFAVARHYRALLRAGHELGGLQIKYEGFLHSSTAVAATVQQISKRGKYKLK